MTEWTNCAKWTPLQTQHMPPPTEEIFTEISKDFNIRWNFPNFIEKIDAKHIRIQCPPNSVGQYFNYKHCHSIVLQGVVDTNLEFVTVFKGAHGKQNDGGVLRNSALYQSLEKRSLQFRDDTLPHIFVDDEAYPLTTYIMKPYSGTTLDRNTAILTDCRVHEVLQNVLLESVLQNGGLWTNP